MLRSTFTFTNISWKYVNSYVSDANFKSIQLFCYILKFGNVDTSRI